ncbi:MAG TPA: PAS domain-containing protein, partial [Xanthobacteraceae bacterium]
MKTAEFQLRGVDDPRLAVHATSALPVWLWSIDGTRILWANPVGAKLFGAANGAILAREIFGPADQQRRQVAQLANRLPPDGATRLERLRGFGAPLGSLVTCGCTRLDIADGSHGVLVVAAAPLGRPMPLVERLQRLVEDIDTPIAAFARDGMFVGASDAARTLLGFRHLSEAGLDDARSDALKQGRVETPIGIGHMVLQRVGAGADVGLVALIAPATTQAAQVAPVVAPVAPPAPEPIAPANPGNEQHARSDAPADFELVDLFAEPANEFAEPANEFAASPLPETAEAALLEATSQLVAAPGDQPLPDYEQPALSGEAPAEFALIDEFAEPANVFAAPANEFAAPANEFAESANEFAEPAEAAAGHTISDQPPEPVLDMQHIETPAEPVVEAATTADPVVHQHPPSSDVEAVADQQIAPSADHPPADQASTTPPTAAKPITAP